MSIDFSQSAAAWAPTMKMGKVSLEHIDSRERGKPWRALGREDTMLCGGARISDASLRYLCSSAFRRVESNV